MASYPGHVVFGSIEDSETSKSSSRDSQQPARPIDPNVVYQKSSSNSSSGSKSQQQEGKSDVFESQISKQLLQGTAPRRAVPADRDSAACGSQGASSSSHCGGSAAGDGGSAGHNAVTPSAPSAPAALTSADMAVLQPALARIGAWTEGCSKHFVGRCKPCNFVLMPSGCGKARDCGFCHLPHTMKSTQRVSAVKRRWCKDIAHALAEDLAG